jgi:D-xylonolactonase
VTFGGDDLTDIYITSAGGQDRKENGPGAGSLFKLNLGIAGRPEFRSKIG